MNEQRYAGYHRGKRIIGPISWAEMMQWRSVIRLKWKGVVK